MSNFILTEKKCLYTFTVSSLSVLLPAAANGLEGAEPSAFRTKFLIQRADHDVGFFLLQGPSVPSGRSWYRTRVNPTGIWPKDKRNIHSIFI